MLPRGADRGELISPLTCVPGAEVVGLGPPSITPLMLSCALYSFLLALHRASSLQFLALLVWSDHFGPLARETTFP